MVFRTLFPAFLARAIAIVAMALLPLALGLLGVPAQAQSAASSAPASASASAMAAPVPAAAPAPSSPAPGAKKNGDTIENPYGLEALWKGADNITRSVLVLLGIMSVGSWYIMIVKLLEQTKMGRHARTVDRKFWSAPSVSSAVQALEKSSAYRFIAEAGVQATIDHGGLKSHIPMNEWIPMSITSAVDRVHAATQGGLAFLATVGSTSPFVGLFGTVWGIYHALTAIGLAVAIHAVLGYNWLARRNKAVMDEVREFSDELSAVILGSAGKAA